MDYYSILGVNRNATPEEIKRSYRKLAMQHHPDRGGDSAKFQQVQEAYDNLSDPLKKQQYDNPQPQGFNFNSGNFQNGNPFGDIFGNFGFRQQRRQHNPNSDITIAADIDLEDVLTGKQLIATYRLRSGRHENVEIEIPKGVQPGQQIRYQGLGEDTFREFPRGNLNVIIRIRQHPIWQHHNGNLITEIKVSAFDLMLGTEKRIDTIDNKTVSLKIPAGTQPGTTFSMSGYGLVDQVGRRGNAHVNIKAEIPKLNETQRQLIADLKNKLSQNN